MQERVEPQGGWEVRVDLVCLLCARTVATAQGPARQPLVLTSIRVWRREAAEAVRQRRCPYCAGRLWLQNREDVYVYAGQRRLRGARAS
jgi:DNA-directed RNA polymerase subunit RPC12/RpoP